jgi:4-hydroxy-tetrahydrodipicolinate reductase
LALRVVHCGTGNVGGAGLAGIINHPDLELVGQYVWSPEKVGVDSGALCGMPDTGVIAGDWDALLVLEADCRSHFADSIGRERAAVEDVCRFLERGTYSARIVRRS